MGKMNKLGYVSLYSNRHSQWRKVAKKLRRKRIRQHFAQLRDQKLEEEREKRESDPAFQEWLKNEQNAEAFRLEQESKLHDEEEKLWLERERKAQKDWQEKQKRLRFAREEKARQIESIRLEWEKEKKRLEKLKLEKEKLLEEKREIERLQREEVETFLIEGGDTPEHLKSFMETNPNKPICPFFQKTGACRFFDVCSRNHKRPCVGRTLLVPNFYSHYSLERTDTNEIGSDSSLEFENEETYGHFKEFFYDVVPEFEKCGNIKHFYVCCNQETHLRGNVYVEYFSTRSALQSYQTFNGRWYGGKQISVQFCNIDNWKSAICGLFFIRRCPKGNSCNFLHVFKNPQNLFQEKDYKSDKKHTNNSSKESERRTWRWSESPERPAAYQEHSEKKPRNGEKHRNGKVKSPHSRKSKSDRHSERRHRKHHSSRIK